MFHVEHIVITRRRDDIVMTDKPTKPRAVRALWSALQKQIPRSFSPRRGAAANGSE
jgi:hypothetical protein